MANMVMIAMTILVKEYVSWERSPVGWKVKVKVKRKCENVTIVLESKNVARLMGEIKKVAKLVGNPTEAMMARYKMCQNNMGEE